MNRYAKCLYTRGILTIASEFAACKQKLETLKANTDENASDTVFSDYRKTLTLRHALLKRQLYNNLFMSLDVIRQNMPRAYAHLMALQSAVTPQVIDDVWTQPYNDLISSINVFRNHAAEFTAMQIQQNVFDTLVCLSHYPSFINASVAEKALLLVTTLGELSLDQFRLSMQLFFGLTDVQILAILMGNTENPSFLRLICDDKTFDLLVEPIYRTTLQNYGERTPFEHWIEVFYPYIPQNGCWNQQHILYPQYLNMAKGTQNLSLNDLPKYENALKEYIYAHGNKCTDSIGASYYEIPFHEQNLHQSIYAHICIKFENDKLKIYQIKKEIMDAFSMTVQHRLLHMLAHSDPYFEFWDHSSKSAIISQHDRDFLLEQLAQSGKGITLEDLFKCGEEYQYSPHDLMKTIWREFDNIMILGDGSVIRLKLPTEYKNYQYIVQCDIQSWHKDMQISDDATHAANNIPNQLKPSHPNLYPCAPATLDEIEDAKLRFLQSQDENQSYDNNSKKIQAYLDTLDKCIALKDLQKVCKELFDIPESSVNRILGHYSKQFHNIARGIWCSRQTALKLGLNIDGNR